MRNIWRRSLADFNLYIAAVLIFFGIVFGTLRLIAGRSVVDRVAAEAPVRRCIVHRSPREPDYLVMPGLVGRPV